MMSEDSIKHLTVDGISRDSDGLFGADCECGYSVHGMPDAETVVDDLMAHTAFAVQGTLEKETTGI